MHTGNPQVCIRNNICKCEFSAYFYFVIAMWHKIFYEIVYKQCPQSNCVMTVDKNELDHADAVLFHLIDIAKENYTFPANRNPDQVWIGMTYEPPYILKFSNLNFTRLNGIFNRTMSYRSDSDVVVRHGTYVKVVGDIQAYPNYMSDWVSFEFCYFLIST